MAETLNDKHETSGELIDPYCDACYEVKKLFVRPEAYCYDCYQCLCKDCLSVHKTLPGSRSHVIRTREGMPKSQADIPPRFEYCAIHHRNLKDQYCSEHKVQLCMICVLLHHKICHVESVERAAKRVPSSEIDLFYDTVSDFKTQLLSAESRIKNNAQDLREQRTKILKEIQEIYDKTKSKIDKLFHDIKSDLESKYQCQSSVLASDQKNIKVVTDNLDSTLDDINSLKGSVVDTKVFLKIQEFLKSVDKCKGTVSNLNLSTRKMFNFVTDRTMNNLLLTSFTMGTISIEDSGDEVTVSVPEILFPVSSTIISQASAAGYQPSRSIKPIAKIEAPKCSEYDIKLKDDRDCWITGLAITLNGRRLLVDRDNMKIKLFSRDRKIISSLSLAAEPWNIAVTGEEEAVVSVYCESRLLILDVSDKQMSVKRTVKLPFGVIAITTYKDKLVVTSQDPYPPSVRLITQSGKICWSTSSDQQGQKLFSEPRYVTCYDDGRSSAVIVTDYGNNTLTLLNSNTGDFIRRRQVEGKGPHGVTADTDGNIYVCYNWTREVAVLAKDFSEEKILLTKRDGISRGPLAIDYDTEDHQLLVSYASSVGCNGVDCFQLL